MSATTFDAEVHVAAMAVSLDLPIRPEWRAEVVAHLAAIARAAKLVEDFPLDETTEHAFVFEAGR